MTVDISTTSRNGVHGLTTRRIENVTEKEIINWANIECTRQGTNLEEVAGIDWVEQDDGTFLPEREWNPGEELKIALEKLNDDGRYCEIVK